MDLLNLPAGRSKVFPQTTPSEHENRTGAEHFLLKILGAKTLSNWGMWNIHFAIFWE